MDRRERDKHEVLRRWILACEGEATPEEEAELFRLLAGDDQLQQLVANIAQDQTILDRCLSDSAGQVDRTKPAVAHGAVRGSLGGATVGNRTSRPTDRRYSPVPRISVALATGALAAMLLVGVTLGTWMARSHNEDIAARARSMPSASRESRQQSVQVMKLSNCVWGAAPRGIADGNPVLRDGEGLELLEGFAQLSIESAGWQANVQLEGPAAIVLSAEGLPILRHGNMLVDLSSVHSSRSFSVELPLSRLHLSAGSKVGIASQDNESEIHVFHGFATLESLWDLGETDILNEGGGLLVPAGQSCSISSSQGIVTQVVLGKANPGLFDVDGLIRGGNLQVTPHYVDTVNDSHPIAYWQFESLEDGLYRNSIQDRFHFEQHGDIHLEGLPGNRHLNFYVGDVGPRYLATSEPISDDLPHDYSIELWINPSHFHTATVLTFLKVRDSGDKPATLEEPPSQHGLLVELGGYNGDLNRMRPQKLRFLHRNPPGFVGGTQLFSAASHQVREWQHVVCVKQGRKMEVYFNAVSVGEHVEANNLASGMIAVVGQMSPRHFERMFFGELDELAIYDRALSDEEIKNHFNAIGTYEGQAGVY